MIKQISLRPNPFNPLNLWFLIIVHLRSIRLFALCYLQARGGNDLFAHSHFGIDKCYVEYLLHDGDGRCYLLSFSWKTDDTEVLHLANEAKAHTCLQYIFIIVAEPGCTGLGDVLYETCCRKTAFLEEDIVGANREATSALRLAVVRQVVHHHERRTLRQKLQDWYFAQYHVFVFVVRSVSELGTYLWPTRRVLMTN